MIHPVENELGFENDVLPSEHLQVKCFYFGSVDSCPPSGIPQHAFFSRTEMYVIGRLLAPSARSEDGVQKHDSFFSSIPNHLAIVGGLKVSA